MILIRLAGGLGNQIFQLGMGLLFAEKSYISRIIIDSSALESYDAKRENKLLSFFDFSKIEVQITFQYVRLNKFRIPKLLPLKILKYPFVSDKNFQIILKNPNHFFMLLDGYFQRYLTQDDFNKEVVLLKSIFIQSSFKENWDCVIHIRGGDFLELGWNKLTSREYYTSAMNTMTSEHNVNNFLIVTDDELYARKVISYENVDIKITSGDIVDDFQAIASCSKRILSSSTFALWASALGVNEDEGIVIAPDEFTPGIKRDFLLPNER
jgi:hypothetical protein